MYLLLVPKNGSDHGTDEDDDDVYGISDIFSHLNYYYFYFLGRFLFEILYLKSIVLVDLSRQDWLYTIRCNISNLPSIRLQWVRQRVWGPCY